MIIWIELNNSTGLLNSLQQSYSITNEFARNNSDYNKKYIYYKSNEYYVNVCLWKILDNGFVNSELTVNLVLMIVTPGQGPGVTTDVCSYIDI